MGKLTLYGMDISPPVRAVRLLLEEMKLPHEYVRVDLSKQEQLSNEFLAKNPQHTIPVLDDDGHYIWDSHAIMAYLVSKYGKNDDLYPKDLLKRAVVDQRLHFDTGNVFEFAMANISRALFFRRETDIPQHKIDNISKVYAFLEAFLGDNPYMAGDKLTIADFSLISTLSTVNVFLDVDSTKYPKLSAWWKRLEALPYFEEINAKNAKKYHDVVKNMKWKIVP